MVFCARLSAVNLSLFVRVRHWTLRHVRHNGRFSKVRQSYSLITRFSTGRITSKTTTNTWFRSMLRALFILEAGRLAALLGATCWNKIHHQTTWFHLTSLWKGSNEIPTINRPFSCRTSYFQQVLKRTWNQDIVIQIQPLKLSGFWAGSAIFLRVAHDW